MYDFKQLSPADFEELTGDLLQKCWKTRLESFKTGRDKGIDLRFAAVPDQTVIVQCKHFAGSTVSRLIRELAEVERPKVVKLNPKRYVLVTSLPLNPQDKDKILAAVQPYVRTTDDVLGSSDLNSLIRQHPQIETRHFKLWLSRHGCSPAGLAQR